MSSNQEIIFWKVEPLSPNGTPPLDTDEEWLNFDEDPAGLKEHDTKSELFEEPLTRAQVATKYLEELETDDLGNWIKEESIADWLEEKIDLPIFEELPVPECGQNHAIVYSNIVKPNHHHQLHQQQQQQQQQQQSHHHQVVVVGHHHDQQVIDPTQTLLREFESVLGDVEACHQIAGPGVVSTLTPPQSPPPKPHSSLAPPQSHLLVSLQPLQTSQSFVYEPQHLQNPEESNVTDQHHHHQQQEHQPGIYNISVLTLPESIDQQWSAENLSLVPLVHTNDVAHELAKVDEYVRSCAADVVGSSSTNSISPDPPSPCTSSNASSISSEDSVDDPDWCFDSADSSPSSSGRRLSNTGPLRQGRRASTKPYSRPNVEDKRVRKKEQNKNAATRYRQKKKQEIKEILGEEQELVAKNEKLQDQVKEALREIGYLKGLMRDLFKIKGLIE